MSRVTTLLQEEIILPIDYSLAERLVKCHGCHSEEAFLFVCYLSKAAREGHLCVNIESEKVLPDPELLNICSSKTILDGFLALPDSLITHYEVDQKDIPSTPLIQQGNFVYFQKNWLDENVFKEHLSRILNVEPEFNLDSESLKIALEALWNRGVLLEEQFEAIRKSLVNTFTIIAGGPGTGKTYTAGLLIKTFWESLSKDHKAKMNMVLAAPTGKAASNLQKSIQKACNEIEGFPLPQAQTLHSLLGKRKSSSLSYLRADFILIDECSMIDASIMSQLLSSVKSGARLIFLGDPHQLPPVESGALFADLNASLGNNRVELKQCLRSDLRGILDFASKVNDGDAKASIDLLVHSKEGSGLRLIGTHDNSIHKMRKFFLDYARNRFPSPIISHLSPAELIDTFNRFRILSPMRRGPFGVDELNYLFLDYFRSKIVSGQTFVAPIMLINNDYRLQLFNGEVGVLVRPDEGEGYLLIQSSIGVRKIPEILIPRYEYAYCLSVHKSQGSEFDEVLALFPEGSEVFGREVLYTAATRARKLLEVWGSHETLSQTIERKVKRISCFTY
jgi:exodeoxyribonuclease V alpha subunit